MGDVNFRDKIDNNKGVVMGQAYNTATDGVKITGAITYHGINPKGSV